MAAQNVHDAAGKVPEPLPVFRRMERAHFGVDGVDFAQIAAPDMLDAAQDRGIVAVHIAQLHGQLPFLRAFEQAGVFRERAAGRLVHVDGLAAVDALLRRAREVPYVRFDDDRVGFRDQLVLVQARKPLVGRKSAALFQPGGVAFRIADHLEQFGKFAHTEHFALGVVVADADLADSYFAHAVHLMPFSIFRSAPMPSVMPSAPSMICRAVARSSCSGV